MTTLRTALVLSASLFALAAAACSSESSEEGVGGGGGSGGAVTTGAGGSGGTTNAGGHGGHFLKKDAGASDAATEDAAPPEPPNSVRVRVIYAGGKSGTMHVGLWKTPPWDGFPDSSKVDGFPTFPYELQLLSVIAGQYTVGVYLDVNNDSEDKPGAGDPQYISPTTVTVTDQAGAFTEITLVDP